MNIPIVIWITSNFAVLIMAPVVHWCVVGYSLLPNQQVKQKAKNKIRSTFNKKEIMGI